MQQKIINEIAKESVHVINDLKKEVRTLKCACTFLSLVSLALSLLVLLK